MSVLKKSSISRSQMIGLFGRLSIFLFCLFFASSCGLFDGKDGMKVGEVNLRIEALNPGLGFVSAMNSTEIYFAGRQSSEFEYNVSIPQNDHALVDFRDVPNDQDLSFFVDDGASLTISFPKTYSSNLSIAHGDSSYRNNLLAVLSDFLSNQWMPTGTLPVDPNQGMVAGELGMANCDIGKSIDVLIDKETDNQVMGVQGPFLFDIGEDLVFWQSSSISISPVKTSSFDASDNPSCRFLFYNVPSGTFRLRFNDNGAVIRTFEIIAREGALTYGFEILSQ